MENKLAILKDFQGSNSVIIDCIPYQIGRCRTANFIIANVNVSRNHCHITRESDMWKIHDFSSSGTFINNVLVGRGRTQTLKQGDVVRFGPVESNLSWVFYTKPSQRSIMTVKNLKEITQESQILSDMCMERKALEDKISMNNSLHLKLMKEEQAISQNFEELLRNFNTKDKSGLIKEKNQKLYEDIKRNFFKLKEQMTKNDSINLSDVKLNITVDKTSNSVLTAQNISENQTLLEKQELEEKLIKQEEEKKILLEKLQEMKEAQKLMSEKLQEANKIYELEKASLEEKLTEKENKIKTQVQENLDSLLKAKEELEESIKLELTNKEGKKSEELLKELEDVKKALNALQDKNVDLEKKLAHATNDKSEALKSKSTFLENVTDVLESELQCTICSELFLTAITLSCTHTFCQYCITQWKKKQKTCPICRKKITSETRSLVVDNYIDKMVENLSSELKKRRQEIIEEREEVPSKRSRPQRRKT